MKLKVKSRTIKSKRWLKLKYLLLLRAKGGPEMVAKGFSIGLAIEMITLPTIGLAFLLIFPLVYYLRASFSGALIGFVFGKLIYIPTALINFRVGRLILSEHFAHKIHFHPHWLESMVKMNIYLIVGGVIVGSLLGLIIYYPIKYILEIYAAKRKEKRRKRKSTSN